VNLSTRSSLFDYFFDPEYRANFNVATRQVPLVWLMYMLCIPLSKMLVWLNCAPTTVTHISNLLAVASVICLGSGADPWLFVFLWVASLFFDIADGTVARVTGKSSASGSFYDHMSDQVKVIALFLAAALRYDIPTIWILSYLVNAGFLFMTVVNQVSAMRSLRLSQHGTPGGAPATSGGDVGQTRAVGVGALRSMLRRHPGLKRVLLGIYVSIFAIYGNSFLLVIPLAFGETWAVGTMIFFGIVVLRSLFVLLAQSARVNRELTSRRISWK